MPKITRKQQKVFAVNATNNGVFGSLQANDPTYSQDPDLIQGRPAYGNGWNDATYSADLLPPLEEFQGLQYLFSRQIAYLYQDGIPEWETNTTYYSGSIVKALSGGSMGLYYSLVDDNTGNLITDTTKWQKFYDSSAAYADVNLSNITTTASQLLFKPGMLLPFAGGTAPSGWLKCDGSAVSRTTYSDLYSVIGTTYGAGDGSTTFNLPNFVNKTFWGGSTSGTVKAAGLPNITGTLNKILTSTTSQGANVAAGTGAFSSMSASAVNKDSTPTTAKWWNDTRNLNFNASKSNSIYGNSTTVQPPALQTLVIIKY